MVVSTTRPSARSERKAMPASTSRLSKPTCSAVSSSTRCPGLASFGDYAEAWLKRRSDDPRRALAPTTRAKYRRLLDAYLLPEFADRKLTRITPEQIRSWNDIVAKEHLSTAADAYRLLANRL